MIHGSDIFLKKRYYLLTFRILCSHSMFSCFCQPMFVMTNDGGVFQPEPTVERTLQAERILSQRIFVLNMICTGTGITLLKGAEYRDSRVKPSFFFLFISNLLRRSFPLFMNQNTLPVPISRFFLKRLRIFMLDFYRNIVVRVLFSKRLIVQRDTRTLLQRPSLVLMFYQASN
jgi:hypothetical protein